MVMKMLRNQANIINIKFHFAFFYALLSSIAHRVDSVSLIDSSVSVFVFFILISPTLVLQARYYSHLPT